MSPPGARSTMEPMAYDLADDLVVVDTDLTRYVRTPAGVKTFHKPIGSPIGGGGLAVALSADRFWSPQEGDRFTVTQPTDAGGSLVSWRAEANGTWVSSLGAQIPAQESAWEYLADMICSGAVESDLPKETVQSIRARRTNHYLKIVSPRVNKIPRYTMAVPKGWGVATDDDLTHLFPDDPERSFEWLASLDPESGGPSGPMVVFKNPRGAVQIDLPQEAIPGTTLYVSPDLQKAIDNYPAGIGRMAVGVEWAQNAVAKAPGHSAPVLVHVVSPNEWSEPEGVMAYTRMEVPDSIQVNPQLAYAGEIDVTPGVRAGWFSPGGLYAPNIEAYTVLHEFGHVNDARMRDSQGTHVPPWGPVNEESKALYARFKGGADKYAQTSEFEMYAEAFTTFYGEGGRPQSDAAYPPEVSARMHQIAQAYAERYRWTK